jgi:hypothetical protein
MPQWQCCILNIQPSRACNVIQWLSASSKK